MTAIAIKAAPRGSLLSASGLTAGYGDRTVLRALDLEARQGELLAVVGPNGAGKSTLLKVLGGSLESWRGAVTIDGGDLRQIARRALARTVATVAQENPVTFQFSALEVVLMGRAPHLGAFHLETAHDVAIALAALKAFGLGDIAGRPIQELSGGERKRVFLARAIAQEAPVILLDEPAAFLDLRHVAEIFTLFRRLCADRRRTVVVTLHDLNVAALYADQVLLLKNGERVAYGIPSEVLTPANLSGVYEVDVHVGHNPASGAIMVWPELAETTSQTIRD